MASRTVATESGAADAIDRGPARVGELQVGQSRWEAQRATEPRRRLDLRERTRFEHQQAQRSECDLLAMIEAVRLIERSQAVVNPVGA